MVTKGMFGYVIGKKKRLMSVNDDADLLWQILVREIYVLMKHFKSKEELQKEFEKIVVVKNKPKQEQIDKCKCFADFERNELEEWDCLLRYCQSSFINIIETGYIINEKNDNENGHIFLLDFNKGEVIYYYKELEGKINELDKAKLEEIMDFEEMPSKSYTEIVTDMKERFNIYNNNFLKIEKELNNLKKLKENSKKQGAVNIEEKVDKLIYDMDWEKKILNKGRRVFYYRLKALELIEEEKENENEKAKQKEKEKENEKENN